MIEPREFMPTAESLAVGQRSRKVVHCGNSPSMIVAHDVKGYRAYCHTCHDKGWVPKHRSLAERIADLSVRKDADVAAKKSLSIPKGEEDVYKWPDYARVWLHKAGMSAQDIMNLRFSYSEAMDRVVMPIYINGQPKFWQARGFKKDLPKYLSPSDVDRTALVPAYGTDDGHVALTEDMLSAIKWGYIGEAWSLLGTKLHDSVLLEIIQRKVKVIVALDPDAAGRSASNTITLRLKAFGVPVTNITHSLPSDPKLMSRWDLASILMNAKDVLNGCI